MASHDCTDTRILLSSTYICTVVHVAQHAKSVRYTSTITFAAGWTRMADEQPHDESQQRAGTSKLRRLKYSLGSSSSLTEPETDKEASSNVVCPTTALGDTNLEVQADAITAVVAHTGDTSGCTSGSDGILDRVTAATASPAIATYSAVPPAISAESLTMSLSSGSPSEPARMTSGDYGYIHEMASSSSEWSSGAVRRSFAVYGSRLPSPMPLCQPPLQSQTL